MREFCVSFQQGVPQGYVNLARSDGGKFTTDASPNCSNGEGKFFNFNIFPCIETVTKKSNFMYLGEPTASGRPFHVNLNNVLISGV